MRKPPRIVLAGLLVATVCGFVWWVSTYRKADSGQRVLINSLEFSGVSADSGRSTNLIAVGDWSKPVKDKEGYALRGRLLVFDTPHFIQGPGEWWGDAPVYLELQNLTPRNEKALAVYFALNDGLECAVYDAQGKAVPVSPVGYDGPGGVWTIQYWATVPFDGSVRLRAGPQMGGTSPKPSGLVIQFGMGKRWIIPVGESNLYLVGNFSPPTNHPSPPDSHVWSGKLELPPVRIPSPKP